MIEGIIIIIILLVIFSRGGNSRNSYPSRGLITFEISDEPREDLLKKLEIKSEN